MSASASTAFRNLELTSEQADAMGLGGEDFDYAVTERALDAGRGRERRRRGRDPSRSAGGF